jgi:hypothetical protein
MIIDSSASINTADKAFEIARELSVLLIGEQPSADRTWLN